MLVENINTVLNGSAGKPILADILYHDQNEKMPVVIFVHGFKGFKDWGHFNLVAKEFANSGFIFVKFNFSFNGTTISQPEEFADLDAFGKNNYSIELNDLSCVIDWVLNNQELGTKMDEQRVYLVGHSRGGGLSLLKAAEDKRINKIVTWAAVSDFIDRLNQFPNEEWKEKGVIYTTNSRTGQKMPLYYSLYENTMASMNRFDILRNAVQINIPCLLIHGTKDEAVPVEEVWALKKKIRHSEILLIESSNHTFGCKHPFMGQLLPTDASEVVQKTILFLQRNR